MNEEKIMTKKEMRQYGLKVHIDKINLRKCVPLKPQKVSYSNYKKWAEIVITSLYKQFNFSFNSKKYDDKKPQVSNFSYTPEVKKKFEDYYQKFFKSKFFKLYAADYILNYEPAIRKSENGEIVNA